MEKWHRCNLIKCWSISKSWRKYYHTTDVRHRRKIIWFIWIRWQNVYLIKTVRYIYQANLVYNVVMVDVIVFECYRHEWEQRWQWPYDIKTLRVTAVEVDYNLYNLCFYYTQNYRELRELFISFNTSIQISSKSLIGKACGPDQNICF